VDVLELTCGIAQPLPAGASGLGRMKHVKRRLVMILDRTPEKSLSRTGKVLIVLLAAMLPLAPIRAEERTPETAAKSAQASAASASSTVPVSDSTRKAIESLLEVAQDPNDQVRGAAMEAIVRFGPQAVPVLVDALSDEKAAMAAQALLPRMDVEGIEGLIEAIDSPKPEVRARALLTLESILRPNAGGGVGDGATGIPGGEGMGAEGAPPRAFAPALSGMMGGGVNLSPQSLSIASWVIAPAAKASRDESPAVRRAAVRVLGASSQIAPDSAIAAPLAAALKDEDATVRRLAAVAMINIAHTAPELTAPLSAAVNDSDRSVRVAALTALGSSGAAAKSAMPLVTQALKDSDPTVRIAAANALGAMQSPPPDQLGVASPEGGFSPPGFVAAPPQELGNDWEVWIRAQNVWHWSKLGRYDLAGSNAEKLLKLGVPPEAVLGAFTQIAQTRHEDLAGWIKRMKEVKELKDLVAALNAAMTPATQPAPIPEIFQIH
jgi:HEAT repeat protein